MNTERHAQMCGLSQRFTGESIRKRVDTGVSVVTTDNLDDPAVQKLLYPLGK